jgi:hypothetical protein
MFDDLTPRRDAQSPYDVAVVLPTILRPSLTRAIRSVFLQEFDGRVQILIGVDVATRTDVSLTDLAAECPENMDMLACRLPYSTSERHGGLYPNRFSGALRSILTLAANSRRVAYLDDDNWWAPQHLDSLTGALAGVGWAWSDRWFTDPETGEPIVIDDWESVGPDAGVFADRDGGFVDPSSLMIDKLVHHDVVPLWSLASFADGSGEDRLVFAALKESGPGRATRLATSFYPLREGDPMHAVRLDQIRARGIILPTTLRSGARPLGQVLPLHAHAATHVAPDPVLAALIGHIRPTEILALASEPAAVAALAAAAPDAALAAPTEAPAEGSLAVDLVHIGPTPDPAAFERALTAGWNLLRPGGILMGPGPVADPGALRRFAERTGSTLVPEAIEDALYWLTQKVGQ